MIILRAIHTSCGQTFPTVSARQHHSAENHGVPEDHSSLRQGPWLNTSQTQLRLIAFLETLRTDRLDSTPHRLPRPNEVHLHCILPLQIIPSNLIGPSLLHLVSMPEGLSLFRSSTCESAIHRRLQRLAQSLQPRFCSFANQNQPQTPGVLCREKTLTGWTRLKRHVHFVYLDLLKNP